MGTVPMFTQRYLLGPNWTTLKLPVVNTSYAAQEPQSGQIRISTLNVSC
jgi:hypothetical protein